MSQLIDLAAEFRENEAKLLVQYWQATGRIQNSYLDREPDINTDGLEEWQQRIASEDHPLQWITNSEVGRPQLLGGSRSLIQRYRVLREQLCLASSSRWTGKSIYSTPRSRSR